MSSMTWNEKTSLHISCQALHGGCCAYLMQGLQVLGLVVVAVEMVLLIMMTVQKQTTSNARSKIR